MNKLYLLAALAACAYGDATTADPTDCSDDMTWADAEDGDYAFTWTLVLSPDTDTDLDGAGSMGTVCYKEWAYDLSIDTVSHADSAGEETAADEDKWFVYYIESTEADDDGVVTYDTELSMADAFSAAMVEYVGDGEALAAEGDTFTTALDDHDDTDIYGY